MIQHVALLFQLTTQQPCMAAASAPALDHAIVVVRDLERAATAFRNLGFKIKQGRLHPNGLLNRHIKFPDGTEIELMTVQGKATDAMARDYADLLAAGEGGVYVALKLGSADRSSRRTDLLDLASTVMDAERNAVAAGLKPHRSSSGSWQFLGFPNASPAGAVFFSFGDFTVQDADSIFGHTPPVSGLAEVWLEGGAALGDYLRALGAAPCDSVRTSDGRVGRRYILRRGAVVLVPPRNAARPRVLGAVLSSTAPRADVLRPIPEFWLRYR
jgi:hypothetical protein